VDPTHERDLRAPDLPTDSAIVRVFSIAQVVHHAAGPQLLDSFDDVVEAEDVRLGEEAAMGVDGHIAVEAGMSRPDPLPNAILRGQSAKSSGSTP
jgi:hypothetical protein